MNLDNEQARRMYRALAGSRRAEQAITDLARDGRLPMHHSGLGHEAIGVGIGATLRPDDCVQLSHRSGLMLAHVRGGCTLREAILARFGRAPSHYGQIPGRPRTLPAVGLVGSGMPMAVGVAMADRLRRRDTVTVTFFGDGGANEGAVHEAMNLAGARRLAMLFVVENNGVAISLPVGEATAAANLACRAAGYGMPGQTVDGQDVLAVRDAAAAAVERARRGDGPSLLEVRIERWESHVEGFPELRDASLVAAARADDGVRRFRDRVLRDGLLSAAELDRIDADCSREIEDAVAEGLRLGIDASEPPPYGVADAWRLAYAP